MSSASAVVVEGGEFVIGASTAGLVEAGEVSQSIQSSEGSPSPAEISVMRLQGRNLNGNGARITLFHSYQSRISEWKKKETE